MFGKMKPQAHGKHFCPDCFYSGKARTTPPVCSKCGGEPISVSHKIHFPSPSASKTRWKEFFKATRFFGWGYMNDSDNKKRVLKTLKSK